MASDAGTRFETQVVAYLEAQGLSALKPRQTKWYDVGDVWVGDDVVLQAKAAKDLTTALRAGVSGAIDQARRAHRPYGFAVVKRPGKSTAEAYVAMPLSTLVKLLRELAGSEPADRV